MANPVFVLDINEEGIVATHFTNVELPVLVAPTPEESRDKFFNTVRPNLVAIGCMNLHRTGFEFDSSFVGPLARSRFRAFAGMMDHLRDDDPAKLKRLPPVSIFGHADPTGDPEYNKTLSGRRAQSVYGVLVRDVDLWEKLFSQPFGGDDWGTRSIQSMLTLVGDPIPFYMGPVDGAKTEETKKATKEAIEAYQDARGLEVDGKAGKATRKVLFLEYMNLLCSFENGAPFKLDPEEHFLTHKKDKGNKGNLQGCSEFNPLLLLSQDEEDEAKKDKALEEIRNATYAEDRRAVVYVFKHDQEIDPARWPCPRVSEGAGGCRERFWSDHKDRLARKKEERRRFRETLDTMACRWYHAFAVYSPCEAGNKLWVIRLRVDGAKDKPDPFKNKAYVVKAGDTEHAPVLRGFTDDNGQLVIPVIHETTTMTLKLDFFGSLTPPDSGLKGSAQGVDTDKFQGEENFMEITLDCGALKQMSAEDLPAEQRLYNLGFGVANPGTWDDATRKQAVRGFQRSRGVKVTGELDNDTRKLLKTEHEGGPEPAL